MPPLFKKILIQCEDYFELTCVCLLRPQEYVGLFHHWCGWRILNSGHQRRRWRVLLWCRAGPFKRWHRHAGFTFLRRRCILSRLRRNTNVNPGTVDTFDIFACRDTRSRVRGRLEYRVLVRDHTLCMLKTS